jgi:TetR/AcrR family transcriptional regulator, transcriptional repressor for nem operon
MTRSETRGKEKRQRLVEGARQLVYQQGLERTTLADVAQVADVPPGNVYYYFKTKDDLVDAAIDAHVQEIEMMLASLERRHRTPRARLKALVRAFIEQRDMAAERGCPHGSLCQELDKRDDELQHAARRLIDVPLRWAQSQFSLMGRRDAADLAVALISAYQGVSLLANTLRDPGLMLREGRRLERWIDSLEPGPRAVESRSVKR